VNRVLRRIGTGLAGVVGLAIVAWIVVYVLSERILQRVHPLPRAAVALPMHASSLVEGERLAIIHGCLRGCHGRNAEGSVMFDEPMIARIVAPNLTTLVERYTDAQFAVGVRHGLHQDGRSLLVMPAEAFAALSDADLGRIHEYLKSLPDGDGPEGGVEIGPLGRIGIATGKLKTIAQLIEETTPLPASENEQAALGRYLAQTTCASCHGTNLRGTSNPDFTSPDLRVVAAYSPEAFARLLRTGTALGGRELGVMSRYARGNLSHLTDAEIAALYSYLHPQAQ
jgi:cytochrome c553